ncbi:hypothetical protein KAFR_0A04780 [Kazachstania africana CBS 2517]|uniref:Glutathione hydrolase n=1 Tax=Kazachstania africana (strain ATCC 22294 / BCRC 22015 / CBS 2517 / CECT 1963 / NBRC 1671 / NRRL Y-8276) TaxID=1071382 RepID=H2ANG3_KAZAF|nr:hypothetical protein KAFR_0A04780 [Kazachstania africana CBS 2517]CCF55913.1 hypothetical protein KAFR_0A04780 [Kazachstania africana CBS 2517]
MKSILIFFLFIKLSTQFLFPVQNHRTNVFKITNEFLPHQPNIDIDPLNRYPSMTPDPSLLKKGRQNAISSDLELCNNLVINDVFSKYPTANAADAAVTLSLCIGMVNFFNSGIGGGGYVTFASNNTDNHLTIDFREMAPMDAHSDMFTGLDDLASKIGGLAVAVPGELMGLWELYNKSGSGTVTWSQLLDPIIDLGYNGWQIDEALGATLKIYKDIFVAWKDDWSFVLNDNKNDVLQEGDCITRPKLSNVLKELSINGSVAPFYDPNHWIVKSMVQAINKYNGIVKEQDFANYEVHTSKPLQSRIRRGWPYAPNNDLTVLTSSGSSSGAALLSALTIMDNFPSTEGADYMDESTFQLVETMKWMASARSRLGDYTYYQTHLPENILEILSSNWTKHAVCKIKDNIRVEGNGHKSFKTLENWTMYEPLYEINDPHGTAHLSVVDKFGNAVSLTTTVNLLFGSLIHDPNTGIILNNEMDDFAQINKSNSFDLSPSIYNLIEPKKRPLSSTAPTIILNELDKPDFILGASGGSRITPSILQAIIRTYWYNMPLLETIAYPRIHHQLLPDQLEIESINMIGKETVKNLRGMGYKVVEQIPKSVINAIKWHNVEWWAVSDFWRKRGVSATN